MAIQPLLKDHAGFSHSSLVRLLFRLLLIPALLSGSSAAVAPEDRTSNAAPLLDASKAPLRTAGRYIVDRRGERVKWACVNWYGAYSTTHAVGGLEIRPMSEIVDRIVELGFNCVRMMYSTQGYVHNPMIDNSSLVANPELQGKRFLEVFDLTMQAMTDAGLMIIINNHNSKSGWCCHYTQDEGLWYVPGYNESTWIESLVFFADRYRTNPLVVGIDLRNEVHDYEDTHLTWGDGNPLTDWAQAATKAGNAVLEVSPDVIIVVMAMCFGMDLRRMKDAPIQLTYPNRVVYQAHNYLEYQAFDNVAKMLAPWHIIRNWTLLFICILILILLMFRLIWVFAGKPRPPPGCIALSGGCWFSFFMSMAAYISWSVYSFGNKFCSVGAETDILPWFEGSLSLACISLLVAVYGACGVRRGRLQLLAASKGEVPPELDEVPSERKPVDREISGEGGSQVEAARSKAEGAAGPALAGDSASASAATENLPDAVGQVSSMETNVGDPRSNAKDDDDARGALCCCAPGFSSCSRSWTLLCRAAAARLRRQLGQETRAIEQEVTPAPFDIGMALMLNIGIAIVILILLLIVLYVFAHIVPTYWWMERHLDGLWGFALEQGYEWTAPVWVGEFGGNVRSQYWLNFVRYLAIRDVDFAYWAINGLKWTEGEINSANGDFELYDVPMWTNESFGILHEDYDTVRHTWKLLDVQALMSSPAAWRPDDYPCSDSLDPACRAR